MEFYDFAIIGWRTGPDAISLDLVGRADVLSDVQESRITGLFVESDWLTGCCPSAMGRMGGGSNRRGLVWLINESIRPQSVSDFV